MRNCTDEKSTAFFFLPFLNCAQLHCIYIHVYPLAVCALIALVRCRMHIIRLRIFIVLLSGFSTEEKSVLHRCYRSDIVPQTEWQKSLMNLMPECAEAAST